MFRRKFLLLASYCDADDPDCTEDYPCHDCLKMCNVFVAHTDRPVELMTNIGGWECNKTDSTKETDRG